MSSALGPLAGVGAAAAGSATNASSNAVFSAPVGGITTHSLQHAALGGGGGGGDSMMTDNAWQTVCLKILPLFNGEGLKGHVEEINHLVRAWLVDAAPQHVPEEITDLFAAGMLTLGAKVQMAGETLLIGRIVDVWVLFFHAILPFLQAGFLPLATWRGYVSPTALDTRLAPTSSAAAGAGAGSGAASAAASVSASASASVAASTHLRQGSAASAGTTPMAMAMPSPHPLGRGHAAATGSSIGAPPALFVSSAAPAAWGAAGAAGGGGERPLSVDIRHLCILLFRDHLVLPLAPRLIALLPRFLSNEHIDVTKRAECAARIFQMTNLLLSVSRSPITGTALPVSGASAAAAATGASASSRPPPLAHPVHAHAAPATQTHSLPGPSHLVSRSASNMSMSRPGPSPSDLLPDRAGPSLSLAPSPRMGADALLSASPEATGALHAPPPHSTMPDMMAAPVAAATAHGAHGAHGTAPPPPWAPRPRPLGHWVVGCPNDVLLESLRAACAAGPPGVLAGAATPRAAASGAAAPIGLGATATVTATSGTPRGRAGAVSVS